MDLRTDRTIGLAMIIVAALVPAAVLALVKVEGEFDAGRPSETAVTPVDEDYPGAPPKSPPIQQQQQPSLPISLPEMPAGPTPPPAATPPPPDKPLPAELTSFTRQVGTARIEPTGTTSTQEEAKFELKPKFWMDATREELILQGKKWKKVTTTRVVVKNGVRAIKVDGGPASKEKLSPEEIDQLRHEADPRTLTRNIQNLPGVKKSRDPKTKLYKYELNLTSGAAVIDKLPEGIREQIPAMASLLGLKLELYADAKDHAVHASLNGVTTINALGIGVHYYDMK